MFDKATQRLVRRIDPDGELIAVSRLNDSEKLKPLAVVMKCPTKLPWQKMKYRPTVFTLNDLLLGEPIQPVLEKTDLVNYEEKHKGNTTGSLEAGGGAFSVSAQGSGASTFSSSLGALCKENVNLQQLIMDSRERKVDLQHPLLKQNLGKPKSKQLFTLVMERIFTTSNQKINYNSKEEGSCNTILKSLKFDTAQMSFKQSGSLQFDTDISMEIPSHTILAYSVKELNIKNDSHFDIIMALEADGFESDFIQHSFYVENEVDGLLTTPEIQEGSSLSILKRALVGVRNYLCVLAQLSHESCSSLLLKFQQILLDRELLSTLESKLDDLVYGDAPCLFQTTCSHASDQFIDTFWDLLQPETTSENRLSTDSPNNGASMKLSEQSQPVLTAVNILMNAAMGLTDDGLHLLQGFCASEVLNELNDLVNLLTDDSQPVLFTSLPAPLQNEDMLRRVEQLFSSSNVVLKIEAGKLWTETTCNSGHLPYILCTIIHGLAYLSENLE
ncbi:gasdermin-E-like [Electrophorus electricus]|uniref:gasdermin-E-like n=1 Tax=Electrophorus electricus TaxID=8005 RepID=UPI0015CF9B1B|nr:gasdermin-E-like [Electrophorus electricus]XP_035384691.1 gasdermin-E-like [Electrophorus electricus]